ncbi:Nif3-like dinuclear metal center hexameric protein [Candidatus Woesearchaeota archaeon]|nr:Nif3-like dinuclear metal center hexameric protein [Candidatus Woesearchaeota archaeon]
MKSILTYEVADFLDNLLDVSNISDPFCKNGIQVGKSNLPVSKIGLMVDPCLEGFSRARKLGCDFLITHHGLWKFGEASIINTTYNRVKFLMDNNISLYVSHIPLDVHPEYGNNAQLAKMCGATDIVTYDYGLICNIDFDIIELKNRFDSELNTSSQLLKFGSDLVKTAIICSGSGSSVLKNYYKDYSKIKNVDLLITGERDSSIYHIAKELGVNVLFLGHYASETVGLKALIPEIKKHFNIEVEFIEIQTGL